MTFVYISKSIPMDMKYVRKAIKLLMEKNLSISFAESMSAGKMTSTFCSIHGS